LRTYIYNVIYNIKCYFIHTVRVLHADVPHSMCLGWLALAVPPSFPLLCCSFEVQFPAATHCSHISQISCVLPVVPADTQRLREYLPSLPGYHTRSGGDERAVATTHCRYTVATLSVHCRYTVATLSLHCRYTVATLSLHCRYTVAALSLQHLKSFCAVDESRCR
jgi:hypothetical protein